MPDNIKDQIEEYKIFAIVRKIYGDDLLGLARALWSGGIRLLEITFDQADPDCINKTSKGIELLVKEMGVSLLIGAGTVLNVNQATAARLAGAKYLISPNTDEKVIHYCKQNNLISIPGAMTPTEMVYAANCGADYVKVFPLSDLGLSYMKAVMAPINHIKFIATGGVGLDNLADILNAGFLGAGIGGYLVDKKLVASGNFEELTKRAKNFVEIVEKSKK